jgi:isocitrate dehydrogenase (NAD+)
MDATRRVLEATGAKFEFEMAEAGVDAMEKHGTPLPDATLESVKRTRCALKGPVTTPVGTGFRSVNVALRAAFDLYACVRPCRTYKGVRGRFDNIDLVVVRENTEDLYAGIEFEYNKNETKDLVNWIFERQPKARLRRDCGISVKAISVSGTERIVRYAFEYARANNRKKVTAVHKSNILKFSDGLFLSVARDVAKKYTDIAFEDRIVDNMCMQLVQRPEEYDVLVLPNLYGDIVSDLCAGLIGGLGVAPGANIGDGGIAIFEAVHGSAPKYKNQNKVNPTALILSGYLMLKHLGEADAATKLQKAVARVIEQGKSVTYDLKPRRDDPTSVGTREMADAIIAEMRAAK